MTAKSIQDVEKKLYGREKEKHRRIINKIYVDNDDGFVVYRPPNKREAVLKNR